MPVRQIVQIDEELCNGCVLCLTPCAEGSIELVNDKAKVVSEELCDGAGFCLAVCPTGALTIETREAPAFDHRAAAGQTHSAKPQYIAQSCFQCHTTEEQAVLLSCRAQGKSLWVCTHCLPALIHG